MPGVGSSRRSISLGADDPRARRDAQARAVDGLQVKDPLFYDNDNKLTADPAAFRTQPSFLRRPITANYRIVKVDELIAVTSTGAPITVTLPPASMMSGRIIAVKDEGGGAAANNITIACTGTETIDGASTFVMSNVYECIWLYSTGMAWFAS